MRGLWILLAFGCTACIPASEVLVSFDFSAVEPIDDTHLVEVSVFNAEGEPLVGLDRATFPARGLEDNFIPVYTEAGRRRFEVYAELKQDELTVATAHLVAYVEPEQTRRIRIPFDSRCGECGALRTCIDGVCASICVLEAPEGDEEVIRVACETPIRARRTEECKRPVGNGFVDLADGTPCACVGELCESCAGDTCFNGECSETWTPPGRNIGEAAAKRLCVRQSYPCGVGSTREGDGCLQPECVGDSCRTSQSSNRVVCLGPGVSFDETADTRWSVPRTSANAYIGYDSLNLGRDHFCVVRWDHFLDCYGPPSELLGSSPPLELRGGVRWRHVATGDDHICAVRCGPRNPGGAECSSGTELLCWGSFPFESSDRSVPQRVAVPWDRLDENMQMDADGDATCAVFDRELWCWGRADRGALGTPEVAVPERVGTVRDAVEVRLGNNYLCVRTEQRDDEGTLLSGDILCRGVNDSGELGRGVTSEQETEFAPIAHEGPWTSLAVGRRHACAVHLTDGVMCWGQNRGGGLGPANATSVASSTPQAPFSESTPFTDAAGATRLTELVAGDGFTCGADGGRLYCWGTLGSVVSDERYRRVCLAPPFEPI